MSNSLENLILTLKTDPSSVEFQQVIDMVASHYDYQPTKFRNGLGEDVLVNEAGTNEGSCKVFAFAQLNNLDQSQTLHCFGHYYRDDVLGNPDGSDHGNIRRFIQYGWQGIDFEGQALTAG